MRDPLALALAGLLMTACVSRTAQSAPNEATPRVLPSVVASATPAEPRSLPVFDGRDYLKMAQPDAAEAATVKSEVRQRAAEPFLKKRLDGLAGADFDEQFSISGMAQGAFTRQGASQKAVLYQYSYTGGLVILEDGKTVAHYSGDPGDYARYVGLSATPDLNGNGRSELVLFRNVEDTPDIFAYLFDGNADSLDFLGSATVFSSNVRPGEDPPEKEEDTAFLVTGRSPDLTLRRETYQKIDQGGWTLHSPAESFSLERTATPPPTLTRIDTSKS